MKHIYRLLSAIVLGALLMTTKANGQSFPQADPAVLDINKQAPGDPSPTGSNISGSAILRFEVANNSGGTSGNGTIPAGAVIYTVTFNPYYTYESLVPSSQFEVIAASPGAPDYTVFLRNTVAIEPGEAFSFYLNVDATQETTTPGGAIVTLNVTRSQPIACGNTSDGNDNVSKSFNVISLITLPVHYIDLTAVLNNDVVNLKWTTKDELNVDHFELERSTDGSSFAAITSRPAAGNTTGETDYTYLDDIRALSASTIYYRVKTVDQDGKFYYSKVVLVVLKKNAAIFAWPNPFTDKVNLKINATVRGKATVRFYTSTGLLVKQMETSLSAGSNFITLDGLAQLPRQTYIIDVIVDNQKVFSEKLVN
jgi:hypothetical protein